MPQPCSFHLPPAKLAQSYNILLFLQNSSFKNIRRLQGFLVQYLMNNSLVISLLSLCLLHWITHHYWWGTSTILCSNQDAKSKRAFHLSEKPKMLGNSKTYTNRILSPQVILLFSQIIEYFHLRPHLHRAIILFRYILQFLINPASFDVIL